MMDDARSVTANFELTPLKGGPACTLELQQDMLALLAEDGHAVMMLPREEAARYLRFDWDLRRGRVVAFRLLGGLRSMRFRCNAAAARAIIDWLPAGPRHLFSKSAVLMLASGAFGIAWPPTRALGVVVLLAALLELLPLKKNLAVLSAALCGACALAALFGPLFGLIAGLPAAAYLYGALLALTAIDELGNAGPNRAVFAARLNAGQPATGRHVSPLVRGVALAAATASVAFLALAAALHFGSSSEASTLQGPADPLLLAIAAVALGAPLPVLLLRARPPYGEALLAAQLLIAVVTIYVWGLGSAAMSSVPVDYTRGVFAAMAGSNTEPYFALPLLVLEFAFRAWFVRAAEREAAEAD